MKKSEREKFALSPSLSNPQGFDKAILKQLSESLLQNYTAGDSQMYPYADNPPDECYHCLEKANRIQDVSYWFNAILDQLYDREEFNSEELERYLDEMAGCLNMKLPSGHLVVTKENPKNDILDEWKTFNNQYLISLKSMGV